MPIIRLQGEAERRRHIHYELDTSVNPIGVGGMGQVFKGFQVDEQTGVRHPVAIKSMYDDLPPSAYERARREANIQLHNDNLVEMYAFLETIEVDVTGSTKRHCYVISELLDGVTLCDLLKGKTTDYNGQDVKFAKEMLQQYHNTPEHFARTVVMSVVYGLMALHNAGYIHRDIHPSNIMITSRGNIKLIDFGIAKNIQSLNAGDSLTIAGNFMGTPEYAAPELVMGDIEHQNQTTDIYAIGILLFQCITGHIPFDGSRYEIMQKQLKMKVPTRLIKNRKLRGIICTACEKNQKLRYQSAAQLWVALEKAERQGPSPERQKTILYLGVVVIGLLLGIAASQLPKSCKRTKLPVEDVIVEDTIVKPQDNIYADEISKILESLSTIRPQLKEYVDGFNKREPIGIYRLAKCLETGDLLEGNRNMELAGKLVHKAAEMELADAQNTLGFYFFHGRAGYACNYDSATAWFKQAIKNGSLDAEYNLALAYDDGRYKGNKQDVKRTDEALALYKSNAEKGYAKGQAALGMYYYSSQNYTEAKKWIELSLKGNLPSFEESRSQFLMGQLYGTGKPGIVKNDSLAFEWYYKSATNGDGYLEAQYYLGIYYQNGRGVKQDLNKAQEWFRKAAKRGHRQAKERIKSL